MNHMDFGYRVTSAFGWQPTLGIPFFFAFYQKNVGAFGSQLFFMVCTIASTVKNDVPHRSFF